MSIHPFSSRLLVKQENCRFLSEHPDNYKEASASLTSDCLFMHVNRRHA